MKRVVVIILSILILVLGVFCTYYTISLDSKRKDEEKVKEIINKDYEDFKSALEVFSKERNKIYEALSKIDYLENMPSLYNSLIASFKSYEEKLDNIVSIGDKLKEQLLDKEYKNKDLSNKKEAYITNYEQTYNYFVSDVKKFNSQLELYNKMVEADTSNSYKKLDLYESKYKELIDLNKDGVFSGIDKE